jgi:hypothetical protein
MTKRIEGGIPVCNYCGYANTQTGQRHCCRAAQDYDKLAASAEVTATKSLALAARLAEATELLSEAYFHGDTDEWGRKVVAFLNGRASVSADAINQRGRAVAAQLAAENRLAGLTDDEREFMSGQQWGSANPVKCPCGVLFLKVDGGYVPVCDCATRNTVTVTGSPE